MVDTHCHLYWPGLIEQVDEVIGRAREAGVGSIVVPGINLSTSLVAQDLAHRFAGVYFAAGVHPSETEAAGCVAPAEFFKPFLEDPKLVAIGEIGLDAHHDPGAVERQRPLFRAQLGLAAERDLPVIIHHRDAGRSVIAELSGFPGLRGVFHCFEGSRRLLGFAREHGFFISLAGNVTYPTAQNIQAQLSRIPEDRLVIETDAPWMPPEPVREGRRCEPAHVMHTFRFLAAGLAKSTNMLRILLSRNSRELFQIVGDIDGA
ncbi:MAG: hypothetical protein A2Y63_00335 [Candidatus Riflebacteria bacterium RBG_13_59_9]|nr:MAG: hypothetical protein A2Y63_00335 [Candidatus Riflebacteria bacterium RBG_13_59_9]